MKFLFAYVLDVLNDRVNILSVIGFFCLGVVDAVHDLVLQVQASAAALKLLQQFFDATTPALRWIIIVSIAAYNVVKLYRSVFQKKKSKQ